MVMNVGVELPVVFSCNSDRLLGMIHSGALDSDIGVLIIVGGPQYRVGSHRQFLLLARALSKQGVSVMRFDVRGMGDSEGAGRSFDQIDEDIRAAVDCFLDACPHLKGVVLWGLCDGASAALFYAYQDSRVHGLVLLNPWVFTEQGAAKTYLKHYYWQRLTSPDFWRKIGSFQFNYAQSLVSITQLIKQAFGNSKAVVKTEVSTVVQVDQNLPLPARMRECFRRSFCPVLLILSGRDLTADEFRGAVNSDAEWQALLNNPRVNRHDFPDADHTFSTAVWRDQVAEWTYEWLRDLK